MVNYYLIWVILSFVDNYTKCLEQNEIGSMVNYYLIWVIMSFVDNYTKCLEQNEIVYVTVYV